MNIIQSCFGLEIAKSERLDGDVNYSNVKYKLTDKCGVNYILKIFPDDKEWQLAKEESLVLEKIADSLSFQVPRNIRQRSGDLFFEWDGQPAKLLHYISGAFAAEVPLSEKLLISMGEKIAELSRALATVDSPLLAARRLFWDVQNTHFSIAKIKLIKEPERRRWVEYYIDRFISFVLPVQHALPHSLIHGDLNDYNILIDQGQVHGFLDFGDATYSPRVNDLAIAVAYLMLNQSDPFEIIGPMIRGYQKHIALTDRELEVLPDLITSRLCISVCNSAEKKHLGLDNAYVLVSEKPAWKMIQRWSATNPNQIRDYFLEAARPKAGTRHRAEDKALELRSRVAPSALGLSYERPILMDSALFQYMFDRQGHGFLDLYNNIPHVGHNHPAISAALSRQIRKLSTNTRYLTTEYNSFSERLLSYFPAALEKVFFLNSGSEANDLAIRMARAVTGRRAVLVLEHGYHGNTQTGIDISAYKFDGKGGAGVSRDVVKLPLPGLLGGPFSSAEAYARHAIDVIEAMQEKPCAFIAEPISGCGGQVPLTAGYLSLLYPYLRSQGIITISDEVQTGFGRLGQWFWGFEMHGVVPDMVVLGKPMGNGHPIAALLTSKAIADDFDQGMEFFSSFGGNPVSCQVASAMLDVLAQDDLQTRAKVLGRQLKAGLLQLQSSSSLIADVRGEGLFVGVEFLAKDGRSSGQWAESIKNQLRENFILSGTDGPLRNVIKIKPPLCLSSDDIDHFLTQLERILRALPS